MSTEQQWTSDRLFWVWQWIFGVHEMWGISWLTDALLASHKAITIWWAGVICCTQKCPRSRICARQMNWALQVVVWDKLTGAITRSHPRYFTTAYHPAYGPTYSIHLWHLCHPSCLWIHVSNINLDWSMVFSMDNPVACRAEIQVFMWILRFSW